jgi:asparagine synthase (glutamine-hydrolysing)
MCGIAGILSDAPDDRSKIILSGMLRDCAHRGPDGEGITWHAGVGFGHRRLAIVDLAGGAQPMWSWDKRFLITFNGEIFNFKELRSELVTHGAKFDTASDTEVILELFRMYGAEGFNKLNGQFAFALLDTNDTTVTLARDPFGEKPLYYYIGKKSVLFGSEVKNILSGLRLLSEPIALNRTAIWDFHSLNYVPGDETFVAGIQKLTPGHVLRWENRAVRKTPIAVVTQSPIVASYDEAIFALEERVLSATRLRLRSDVPVGIFLSGGIDSGLGLAAAEKVGGKLRAFTADFSESGFSEWSRAARIAQHFNTPHERCEIRLPQKGADLVELLRKIVWHADVPLADSSAMAVYLLSAATAQQVKVVVSGDGGDELFGGYLTYGASLIAHKLPKSLRILIGRLQGLVRILPEGQRRAGYKELLMRFMRCVPLPAGAAHLAWNGTFHTAEKMRLLNADFTEEAADTVLKLGRLTSHVTLLKELMLLDQREYLVNDILVKVDRMTMAHGLEARPLWLDPGIVALARAVPAYYHRSESGLGVGKQLLHGLARKWGIAPLTSGRKQGFSIPIHHWMRTLLRPYLDELFRSQAFAELGIYDPKEVLKIWEEHCAAKAMWGFELWGIMVTAIWAELFFTSPR